jgi:hypothetical protein
MRNLPTRPRENAPDDVGTLWTMRRSERCARCALMTQASEWELRVLVEEDVLLTERCNTAADAFEVAERWRHRMLLRGWQQVKPAVPLA